MREAISNKIRKKMQRFEISGGRRLKGSISVNGSKNATVAILAAAMMNRGTTTIRNVPQIEEVNRWIEVLQSMGVKIERNEKELKVIPPKKISIGRIDKQAAQKTRSVIMLIGSLLRCCKRYSIPQAGGCKLGKRIVSPHFYALENFGVKVDVKSNSYEVDTSKFSKANEVVLYESGDTVTETALMAAAQIPAKTTIKMATGNYMVQDLCFYLQKLGVRIKGIGTPTLEVEGLGGIKRDVAYDISEDPIEAMFFISLAIATKSDLTIKRCPIDFLELELLKLRKMGQKYQFKKNYFSKNGKTKLVDIRIIPSELKCLEEKIHALPFPGINQDNLPFFVPIAMFAKGRTLIHDWAYENRAIYFTELTRLGAKITLLDPHRVYVEGPAKIKAAEMMCPPALRPAAIILVVMLAAPGRSILRDVYSINRGYEDLQGRLRGIGAEIKMLEQATS